MRVTLAQIRVVSFNPERNYQRIKQVVETYKEETDLIIFPEMCVGGYFLEDKYKDKDVIEELLFYNEKIKDLSKEVGIIWGNVYQDEKYLYNAAYFAFDGEWVKHENEFDDGFYVKHLLPNYGIFDDARFFKSGYGEFSPFIFKDKKISIQICEDLWEEGYELSPTENMLMQEPDLIVNISSSPWTENKEYQRDAQIEHQYLDIPFIYVNHVGIQNTGKNVLMYDGGSKIIYGSERYELNDNFEDDVETINLEAFFSHTYKTENKLYEALVHGVRYFDEEIFPFKPNWVVGLSGGLDSSVSAGLLSAALGKDRIVGVNMPSKHNASTTIENAALSAKAIGCEYLEIPIEEMVSATTESLNGAGFKDIQGLALENIQARLRGHTLMSIASLNNGVIVNNGNKLECALGYSTLYGDAIGALSTLADLTKLQVIEMANVINKEAGKEIVPANLIGDIKEDSIDFEFAPSAELKADQVDPMKWGYHDRLIPFLMEYSILDLLKVYESKAIYNTQLGTWLKVYGLEDPKAFIEDLEWVVNTMTINTYKRIQFPPILTVSTKAFGMDYRESQRPVLQTQEYNRLKEAILNAL